jgi:hypothetical protein
VFSAKDHQEHLYLSKLSLSLITAKENAHHKEPEGTSVTGCLEGLILRFEFVLGVLMGGLRRTTLVYALNQIVRKWA